MSGNIGKDSDYAGGSTLRKIDKALQSVGIDRDSSFMKACHKYEHIRRSIVADNRGDRATARAELKRAFSENNKY